MEIIDASKKDSAFMEIHIDETDTLYITSDLTEIKNLLSLQIIETLSCNFDLSTGQDQFKLRFKPDKEIFSFDRIDYNMLYGRLKELAQINKNMKFILMNHENTNVIHFDRGLETMLMEHVYELGFSIMNCGPFIINFAVDDVEVSVSMIYAYAPDVTLSYVTCIPGMFNEKCLKPA